MKVKAHMSKTKNGKTNESEINVFFEARPSSTVAEGELDSEETAPEELAEAAEEVEAEESSAWLLVTHAPL